MLEIVISNKDLYDEYDLNPEIIFIEDFDFTIQENIQFFHNLFLKFFDKNNFFFSPLRKLILSSSTILMDNYFIYDNNFQKFFHNYFLSKFEDIKFHNNFIIWQSLIFMNFDYYLKNLNIQFEIIKNKNIKEEKCKILINLLKKFSDNIIIICCNYDSFDFLNDYMTKNNFIVYSCGNSIYFFNFRFIAL